MKEDDMVDLEQFREAVACWRDAALPANDVEAERKAEADRLLSIIDSAGEVDADRIFATFRCESNGIVGTTRANVHSISRHDDGYVEVVLDHWPTLPDRIVRDIATRAQQPAPVVDDAMVERALNAARDASDARLPRYSVVRAILTAALAHQPAPVVDDARMARALEWVRAECEFYNNAEARTHLSAIEEAVAAYNPNCGARTVRVVDDAMREDAERYRWLREHFRFANDSMRELWFDPVLEPNDSGVPDDLDQEIDHAMSGANARIEPRREAASAGTRSQSCVCTLASCRGSSSVCPRCLGYSGFYRGAGNQNSLE